MNSQESETYRSLIDALVRDCLHGQGQIGRERARSGVWNAEATIGWGDHQGEFNSLLASLDDVRREVLGRMLVGEFVRGVHQTLVTLHAAEVKPFDDGYEGSPFNDFTGRLEGWPWPT
jgi:hypothetical protein